MTQRAPSPERAHDPLRIGLTMINAEPEQSSLADRAARAFEDYRQGRMSAMAELVELLTPILWHTARAQRLDTATAEDVLQSSWLALVRSADSISDPRAVLQWLIVATRREAWRVLRSQGRQTPQDIADDAVVEVAESPELAAVRGEAQQRLWKHVSQLPERCRALLRVIAFADRPDYAELARSLGMPIGSIGPTRGRCLAKLRASLDADVHWEAP